MTPLDVVKSDHIIFRNIAGWGELARYKPETLTLSNKMNIFYLIGVVVVIVVVAGYLGLHV
jgi:hypothetical protein